MRYLFLNIRIHFAQSGRTDKMTYAAIGDGCLFKHITGLAIHNMSLS